MGLIPFRTCGITANTSLLVCFPSARRKHQHHCPGTAHIFETSRTPCPAIARDTAERVLRCTHSLCLRSLVARSATLRGGWGENKHAEPAKHVQSLPLEPHQGRNAPSTKRIPRRPSVAESCTSAQSSGHIFPVDIRGQERVARGAGPFRAAFASDLNGGSPALRRTSRPRARMLWQASLRPEPMHQLPMAKTYMWQVDNTPIPSLNSYLPLGSWKLRCLSCILLFGACRPCGRQPERTEAQEGIDHRPLQRRHPACNQREWGRQACHNRCCARDVQMVLLV